MELDSIQRLEIYLLVKEYAPDDKIAEQLTDELIAIIMGDQTESKLQRLPL
jgi:hypothetical protein